MSTTKIIYGLYADDDDMMNGVRALRSKNIEIAEVYTPFPVHGLDKALAYRKTRISDAAFGYAIYGVTIGTLVTWYTMNHDWPQDIGGKPAFSWGENMPAFVVPMFELMVFCAAHLMSLTFLVRNKMYPLAPAQNPDPRTTDDKFLIEVHADNVDAVKQVFSETGVEEVSVMDANPPVLAEKPVDATRVETVAENVPAEDVKVNEA